MSTQFPETPGDGGGPAPPGGNRPQQPAPQPSSSEALWLIITVVNLTLLLWLIPEDRLEFSGRRIELLVKIVPVLLAIFVAGYLWLKAQFAQFVRHPSYKIIQTALLAVLLTTHASQLPIFPVYPKVEPGDALVGIDTAEPKKLKKNPRFFMTVGPHTATVTSADGEYQQKFDVTYKDVFFGFFYQPNWSLHNKVTVHTVQHDVRVMIKKTDAPFDPEFRSSPPETMRKPLTSLTAAPDDPSVMHYVRTGEDGVVADNIRLPAGSYELIVQRPGCADTHTQALTVTPSQPASVAVQPLCLDEQP